MCVSVCVRVRVIDLELPPGVELPQLFHRLGEVDLVGVTVPLLQDQSRSSLTDATHPRPVQ